MKAINRHLPGVVSAVLIATACCSVPFISGALSSQSLRGIRLTTPFDTLHAPRIDLSEMRLRLTEDFAGAVPVDSAVVSNGVLDSIVVHGGESVIGHIRWTEDSLFVTPAPDSSGPFTLRWYASNEDTVAVADLHGTIEPMTDLRLTGLESNETDRSRPGLVRVFDDVNVLLADIASDETGRFPPVQLPANRLEYHVVAAITREGEPYGYGRTVRLELLRPGEDVELPSIRTVPFDGLYEHDVDPETFRNHVLQVTDGRIMRWDVKAIEGVFIHERATNGRFSRGVMERIRHLWTNPDLVPRLADGAALRVVSGRDTEIIEQGGVPHSVDGWIIIAPDETLETSSVSNVDDLDGDGLYDSAVILLHPQRAESFGGIDRFITYEAGRVLGMSGRVDPLSFAQTAMVKGIGPQVPDAPTFVDEKTAAILYETDFAPLSDVSDFMGMQFYTRRAEPVKE